jgi:hypothetical protein
MSLHTLLHQNGISEGLFISPKGGFGPGLTEIVIDGTFHSSSTQNYISEIDFIITTIKNHCTQYSKPAEQSIAHIEKCGLVHVAIQQNLSQHFPHLRFVFFRIYNGVVMYE